MCNQQFLTKEELVQFAEDGVLVVHDVLSPSEVQVALQGLTQTLSRYGVNTEQLSTTGHAIKDLSSTNGSGGVLDVFYEEWRMKIASHPKLFDMTTQLWDSTYYHCGEEEQDDEEFFRWHPYGPFNVHKGYMYIDRIGYRLPTKLAEKLGSELESRQEQQQHCAGVAPDPSIMSTTNGSNRTLEVLSKKKKKKRSIPVQRSLTPHLDCCPENLFTVKKKWRPIQCFVSLTDTEEENHGGFEAAMGFHKTFHTWAKNRPPTIITRKNKKKGGVIEQTSFPAPCIGEYSHIRPKEDCDVMERIKHIPVKAGSAVFWDNRIPHANAYRHDGDSPRCVVYCSFLPDVAINRNYVSNQLAKWKAGVSPNDQWIGAEQNSDINNNINENGTSGSSNKNHNGNEAPGTESDSLESNHRGEEQQHKNAQQSWMTPLARKLMGIDSW